MKMTLLLNGLLCYCRYFEMQFSVNLTFLLKRLFFLGIVRTSILCTYIGNILQTDMRGDGKNCHKWSVEADVECLACDPHNEHTFVVSDFIVLHIC